MSTLCCLCLGTNEEVVEEATDESEMCHLVQARFLHGGISKN